MKDGRVEGGTKDETGTKHRGQNKVGPGVEWWQKRVRQEGMTERGIRHPTTIRKQGKEVRGVNMVSGNWELSGKRDRE